MHPVQQAIDILMEVCDGAKTRDNVGFSKADVGLIHYDAAPDEMLNDSTLAKRLTKYHRQLGEDLTAKLQDLHRQEITGLSLEDCPGVLYVEEGYLKLYTKNTVTAGVLMKQAGGKICRGTGFKYVESRDNILVFIAAGFRAAQRTIDWCAANYGRPNEYDLFA